MTEIGRYPIPVEDRLCPTCNVIEDEEHFMLECTQYNREALINWCTNNHKPFQHLQNSERFQFILGTRNTKLINLTASFVQKNLKKRTTLRTQRSENVLRTLRSQDVRERCVRRTFANAAFAGRSRTLHS